MNGPALTSQPLLETVVATLSLLRTPPVVATESGFDDEARLSQATDANIAMTATTTRAVRALRREAYGALRMKRRGYVMRRTGQRVCVHGL